MKSRLVFLGFLALIACVTNPMTTGVSKSMPGGHEECTHNESGDFILCVKIIADNKSPRKTFHIQNNQGENIYEGALDGGYVRWLDDFSIEFFQPPGMISSELSKDDITKVFEVRSRKVMSKTMYLNQE